MKHRTILFTLLLTLLLSYSAFGQQKQADDSTKKEKAPTKTEQTQKAATETEPGTSNTPAQPKSAVPSPTVPSTGNAALDRLYERYEIAYLSLDEQGIPKLNTGVLSTEPQTEDPLEVAYRFFEENQESYRMKNPRDELRLQRESARGPNGKSVRLYQIYRGVPVYHGQLSVAIVNGYITLVNSQYYAGIDLSVNPDLTEDQAKARLAEILKADPKDIHYSESELTILVEENKQSLTWRIVAATPQGYSGMFFIDAHTGKEVKRQSLIEFSDSQTGQKKPVEEKSDLRSSNQETVPSGESYSAEIVEPRSTVTSDFLDPIDSNEVRSRDGNLDECATVTSQGATLHGCVTQSAGGSYSFTHAANWSNTGSNCESRTIKYYVTIDDDDYFLEGSYPTLASGASDVSISYYGTIALPLGSHTIKGGAYNASGARVSLGSAGAITIVSSIPHLQLSTTPFPPSINGGDDTVPVNGSISVSSYWGNESGEASNSIWFTYRISEDETISDADRVLGTVSHCIARCSSRDGERRHIIRIDCANPRDLPRGFFALWTIGHRETLTGDSFRLGKPVDLSNICYLGHIAGESSVVQSFPKNLDKLKYNRILTYQV